MGDSQAMFHQHAPQNKKDHTSCPLGINLLLWEANLFTSTLKVKSNTSQCGQDTTFILTYETLMLGRPPTGLTLLWGHTSGRWSLNRGKGLAGPSLPPRCLYPQPNDDGKNRTRESRNDPSVHKCIFLPLYYCRGAPLGGAGGNPRV